MQQQSIDLSSFPLLRIDQVPHHDTQTLVDSEAMLSELEREGDIDSITPFISKLLTHVRKEIAHRRGEEAKTNRPKQTGDCLLPSTSVMISPQRPTQGKQMQSATRRASSPSPSFVVFSSPKLKSSSFLSRTKLAKASLKARSNEAVSLRLRQERHDRTRQALDTMQQWRTERENARKLREERLNEERRLRMERWNARIEREQQVHTLMHAAAEEAKSMALESGCTNEDAWVEAAAAASRVVDDESTAFESVDTQSDDGSFINDDCRAAEDSKCNITNNVEAGSCQYSSCQYSSCQYSVNGTSQAKIFCQEEVQLLPTTPFDSAQKDTICDVYAATSSLLSAAAVTECEACPPDLPGIPPTLLNISSHSAELRVDGDLVSTCSDSSDDTSIDIVETNQNESHCHDHAQEQTMPLPPMDEIDSKLVQLGMKSSTVSSPINETNQVETKPSKICTARDSRCRNTFPSFSSIIAYHTSDQKGTNTADVKQRELSRLMQNQIEQFSKMKTVFEALKKETEHHSKDDSSECSGDSISQGLFYRIHSHRPEVMSIIRTAFSDRLLSAWKELPTDVEGNAWNLLWVWGLPKASTFDNLLIFQKINRFRNTRGLTRKDLLKKNIQRCCNSASSKGEEAFNIMPLTFALPHEFASFVSGYQSIQQSIADKSANYWIIKPVGLSRGRGISIVNDIADVSYSRPVVIQRYITNPLCFMGFKFDLRMYILVTSFSPLEAFIYKEGLARFGSKKYSLTPELLHDRRIHLTNSSVQQEYSEDIDRSHPAYLAGKHGFESKSAFSWLWKRLDALGIDTTDLWLKLMDVCRKALIAAGSDIQCQPNSFEIFGYDLMFDQNLKCWLIEVNSSPSLACESPLDTRIKGSLIRDTIALVHPPAYDRSIIAEICERRMTHRQSAANNNSNSDVARTLMHKAQRRIGEMPKKIGNYERLVPVRKNV